MLFKKILSFALAAAMVSALPAFPAVNGAKVIAADPAAAESGDFSLLTSEYEVAVGNTVQIAYSGSANGLMTQIDNPFIISDDASGLVIKGLRTGSSGVSFFSGGKEFKALITVVPNPDITDVCDICREPLNTDINYTTTSDGEKLCQKCYPTIGDCCPRVHDTITDEVTSVVLDNDDTYHIFFKEHGEYCLYSETLYNVITNRLGAEIKEGDKVVLDYDYYDLGPDTQKCSVWRIRSIKYAPEELTFTGHVEYSCARFVRFGREGLFMLPDSLEYPDGNPFAEGNTVKTTVLCEKKDDIRVITEIESAEVVGTEEPVHIEAPYKESFTDIVVERDSEHITFREHGRFFLNKGYSMDSSTDVNNLNIGGACGIVFYYRGLSDTVDLITYIESLSAAPVTTADVSVTTVTTTTTDAKVTTTTTSDEPEIWMWMTGVDHFDSIRTRPTKTIYTEGEELDLSGLVINAYHHADKFSNKGNSMTVRTDYVWEVEKIDPKYITIENLGGEIIGENGDMSKLRGGYAYTVVIGGGNNIRLNVKGDQYEKEMYDTQGFRFRIYVSPKEGVGKFIAIDKGEVEAFDYGSYSHGFVIKGYGAFSIDMDAHMHINYNMPSGLQKGDIVSGVLYINSETNYIITGDMEVFRPTLGNGDANCDTKIELADAILIMQALANPNKYGIDGSHEHCLTEMGRTNADVNGGGMTSDDALDIQLHLLGKKTLAMR